MKGCELSPEALADLQDIWVYIARVPVPFLSLSLFSPPFSLPSPYFSPLSEFLTFILKRVGLSLIE